MKIAIIGTGMVGRALAGRLAQLGHNVVVGTRNVAETLARTGIDGMGNIPYSEWREANSAVRLASFSEAGAHGEIVVNASHGAVALDALKAVGSANLAGKVLLDVALPLDLSEGLPPKLLIANTDSLGESIQRAFPEAKVVKSLNSVAAHLMIDPAGLPGSHNIFVSGNDGAAKETVRSILAEFGWSNDVIIDLGDIKTARAAEMYAQLYFQLFVALGGTFDFNISIVRN